MNGYQGHQMYRQMYPYLGTLTQAQSFQQAGLGEGPYQMPPMYCTGQAYIQPNLYGQIFQQGQILNRGHPNSRQLYENQMEQCLRDQRTNFQQQVEQQIITQRKINQHKKNQLELASVRSALGDNVCVAENFPFKYLSGAQEHKVYGVVKICNLPYAVTKHEIQQLLGRHAGILDAELGGGIHIIMERSTAKTMDAFVEFNSQKDAETTAHRLSFTESGRYPRLGTRHVDIIISSQDELLQNLFPRAKCIEWCDGIPKLLPNNDPYSAGFKGFLTSEEIRGLISHALNPARSPFTERCRQRTYECLISTLWKFPWFATTMYTVGDRDEVYQATFLQLLELNEKVKQRKVIGLNESLLMDLLRAGLKCPSFNERQKVCLLAAAEMPLLSPIIHSSYFEFWPFDCLAKDFSATEYKIMFYAQLIRRALGICNKDDLAIPNHWRNRDDLAKSSPWGHLWIEWNFHNKETTFDAAAKLELLLATDLLHLAIDIERQHGMSNKDFTTPFTSGNPQTVIKQEPDPLSEPWAQEEAKLEAVNHESPSSGQSSDEEHLSLAVSGIRIGSGSSSIFSGGISHVGSTDGSMVTTDGENKAKWQVGSASEKGNVATRHQHSQSLSAIAASPMPFSFSHNQKTRRGESISIPPAAAVFAMDTAATNNDTNNIDVGTLMAQHGIWSTPTGKLTPFSMPGRTPNSSEESEGLNRTGPRTRPAPSLSLTSQQRGLTIVSEDVEETFHKCSGNSLGFEK